MNILLISERIDSAIRNLLYLLILLLPYSSAAVETCVILALVLWIIKHSLILYSSCKSTGFTFKLIPRSLRPAATIIDLPILCFLGICLISVIHSKTPLSSFRAFLTKTSEWFVVLYLVRESITEKKHILIVLGIFIVTTAITAVDAFIQFYMTGQDIFLGRQLTRGGATAGFNHANGLGGYLTIVIPVILALFWFVNKRKLKGALLCLLAACSWTLAITVSRGAWLSALAGIFILFIMKYKIKSRYLLAGLVGCVLLAHVFLPLNMLARARMDFEAIHNTVGWRWGLWEDSFKMIRERPFLGHGVNTFMRLFQQYRRKAFEGNPMLTPQPYGPTYAHNCFVQMAAEVGLLGLMCFLWLLFIFFKHSFAIMGKKMPQGNGLKSIFMGLTSGLCAFLMHCFFDTHLYSLRLSVYFWFMMAVSLNILGLLKRENYDINENY